MLEPGQLAAETAHPELTSLVPLVASDSYLREFRALGTAGGLYHVRIRLARALALSRAGPSG